MKTELQTEDPNSITLTPPYGGVFGVMEKIKQNGAFAFGALWIILREHHIHEAARATHKNHGSGFRAVRVTLVLLVQLRRHARARR